MSTTLHHDTSTTTDWLLNGDPAIRWQTMRDLTSASATTIDRERRKIANQGWGARLLELQNPEGRWAAGLSGDSGLYSPKWISTTYTMLLLRDLGLPPNNRQARKACKVLLNEGMQPDGGVAYGTWAKWQKKGETCVTSMVLSILSHFEYDDERLDTIADHLLAQQMPDGGWNCRRSHGATHSSVNTSISALEGLRNYELFRERKVKTVQQAQGRAREFLLVHRLFRSDRTGEIIKPVFTKFSFPPRWHYDVLRALDYFQSVNAPWDERLNDAIELLRKGQSTDGRWPLQHIYKGKTYFEMEKLGSPSRWNTLRALRVLAWWDHQRKLPQVLAAQQQGSAEAGRL